MVAAMPTQLNDLLSGFRDLKLGKTPVIVHASLSSFGYVDGGADTVVKALITIFQTVVVPTFTYKTMLTPLTGPENNAIVYGSSADLNRMAEFFTPEMPADRLMGVIPETLRKFPRAKRSVQPIHSFAGINADFALNTQTMTEPMAPIGTLARQDGWVLMLGVDHTVNTSIHYAEKLAGRKQFIRWALTRQGVRECPSFPGCSAGFQSIVPDVEKYTRHVKIGNAVVQAVPLKMLFKLVTARINKDPLALLCQQEECERCKEIRRHLAAG